MNNRTIIALIAGIVLILSLWNPEDTAAQNRFDALRYNLLSPGQDAATMGVPSLTDPQDLGAVMHNPASAALFEKSFFSFDVGTRNVREEGIYLNNRSDVSSFQTGISSAGFNFKAPTERGSLVFGLGYNQLADFNRAQDLQGFNDQSTITDLFLIDWDFGEYYGQTAFDAFAIDEFEENGDLFVESSWRPPFSSEYVGVEQFIEITERGQLGEYYAYGATEFLEGLFIGGSIGIPAGSYKYDRTYIEERPLDVPNDYDVNSMLTEDRVRASVSGFTARLGLMYQPSSSLSLGFNAELPSALNIEEDFDTYIETIFEDGSSESAEFNGSNDYEISRPVRLSGGASISPSDRLTFSGSAEWVDYSNIEMSDVFEERQLERQENQLIQEEFDDVFNLSGGVVFNVNEMATLRGGIAYHPSPVLDDERDKFYYSGGLGFAITPNTTLDLGVQLANWTERIYDFEDVMGADLSDFFEGNLVLPDYQQQDIWRYHFMLGFTFGM